MRMDYNLIIMLSSSPYDDFGRKEKANKEGRDEDEDDDGCGE